MVVSGKKWWIVAVLGVLKAEVTMAEQPQSLRELALEINTALAKAGRASRRREFNARLWACNGERALALIGTYRKMLAEIMDARGPEEAVHHSFRS